MIKQWPPDEVEQLMARPYQIRLNGSLDASWSAWFDGLTITHDGAGDTLLEGAVRDQTALYDLLDKARDLGLSLIAVEQRAPATESDPLVSTVTHVIPGRTGGSDEETPLLDVNC